MKKLKLPEKLVHMFLHACQCTDTSMQQRLCYLEPYFNSVPVWHLICLVPKYKQNRSLSTSLTWAQLCNTVVPNPLHPNISMHILHTVLYKFPKVLTRRICIKIKSFLSWWLFALFLWPGCSIQGWFVKEKLDSNHSQGLKVQWSFLCLRHRI